MNEGREIRQIGALAVVTCLGLATTATAQDLCVTGQIQFAQSAGALTINFPNYFPIKLVTSEDCTPNASCIYDVAVVSADQTAIHLEGLEIASLCANASERRGEFERHAVSEFTPLLTRAFEFSRNSDVVIDTASGTLTLSRTDYAPVAERLGWLAPLVEGGGNLVVASPAATSYKVTFFQE